jgi:DNA-binding NarL/FixJ family response regulator
VRIARTRAHSENEVMNGSHAYLEAQLVTSPADAQRPIRVFLIDDQAMLRASFKSLLARDPRFEVVGDSGDPRRGVELVGEVLPDVVLLDISMPGLSGIDAIPLIMKAHPRAKIVMLTHHEGESFVQQALRAGADGYLSKDSDPAELALALEAAIHGNMFLSPRVTGGLVPHGSRSGGVDGAHESRLGSLTAREREVLQLLALGRTNKDIATALQITLGTAKKHRENLDGRGVPRDQPRRSDREAAPGARASASTATRACRIVSGGVRRRSHVSPTFSSDHTNHLVGSKWYQRTPLR